MINQTQAFIAFSVPKPKHLTEKFNKQNPIRDYIVREGYPTFKVVQEVYGGDVGMDVIVNPVPVRHLCEQEYLYECIPLDTELISEGVKDALNTGVVGCRVSTLSYTGYQLGLWK